MLEAETGLVVYGGAEVPKDANGEISPKCSEDKKGRLAAVLSVEERSPASLEMIELDIKWGQVFRQHWIDLIDHRLGREAWPPQGRAEEPDNAVQSANSVEKEIISAQREALGENIADLEKRVAERQEPLEANLADCHATLDAQIVP